MQDVKIDSIKEVPGTTTVDKVKKELVVEGPSPYGLFRVKFVGGGELPDALKGATWTSRADAEAFLHQYNESKK